MASANSTSVTVVTADPAFEAAMRATFGASNAIDLTIVSGSLPEHAGRHEEGPGLAMVVSLLTAALNHCCTQEQIAFGLVGSAGDLRDLVRWYNLGRPDDRRPELARGWREEVCGAALIEVLSGRRALRIGDPTAEVPVVLAPVDDPVQDS